MTAGKYGVALSVVENAQRVWEPTVLDFGNVRTSMAVSALGQTGTKSNATSPNPPKEAPYSKAWDSRQNSGTQETTSKTGGQEGSWDEHVPDG